MPFRAPRPAPLEIAETTSAKQCVDHYMDRIGLTENKLSICIRVNQQYLNKITNRQIKNVDVSNLVCICLALCMSLDESIDMLSRFERAFSPASPLHHAYQELIEIYSEKNINYKDKSLNLGDVLEEADQYLVTHGCAPLPDRTKGKNR